MKEQVVTDEVLNTLMTEVESILNSKPLVPVTFNPDNELLTPNHLLLHVLRGSVNLPPGLFDKRDSYVQLRWTQTQFLADEFWRRWVRKFLPNITYHQKWQQKHQNLKLEDIVLVVDDSLPHSKWTIGRVVETFTDKHKLVQTVNVKTNTTVLN